ncbi:MAG: DUF3347 domain-containing protein, partial [Chitinivibrionales bacterium]|nr:DUF3347 domain-containing protein [Chitinivibrionales bacterium]MBD3395102.1 DUF3347 domain-containing protein [Chitinivibrionales bacterium]
LSYWLGARFSGSGRSAAENKDAGEAVADAKSSWTCSMHPQIRMPEPGQCPICFMDLIPVTEGDADGAGQTRRLSMSESARALAGIATAPAVRRSAAADIRMSGKISLDETRVEMISARVAGRIDRLFVDYTGVPVTRGDHLARMYSPQLISLQKELLEASRAASVAGENGGIVQEHTNRTFAAAQEKLHLLGFSDRELERILARGTTSEHMTIRAGQKGIVLKKLVEEGAYVQTGTPLFHIADLTTVWVKLDAYESDLVWLRLGQDVEFSVEAWPGRIFAGTVSFIDPVVDPETRTVNVRVIADNRDGRLKPDMFVRARIRAGVSKSGGVKASASLKGKWISPMHPQIVKDHPGTCDICGMPLVRAEELGYVTSGLEDVDPLLIPATAPLLTGERAVVYVEIEDAEKPTFEGREVVLGPRVGESYIVKSGIAEGEKVVVNGAFKIDGELQIRAKPSMMSPQSGASSPGHDHQDEESSGKKAPGESARGMHVPDISGEPVAEEFRAQLTDMYETYFKAAAALASDDLKGAKAKLARLAQGVAGVTHGKGRHYEAWEVSSRKIRQALEHAAHVGGMPDARRLFEKVSRHVIAVQKHYGHGGERVHYLAFCPMAFGNKGAYWLQTGKEIRNPYFGAKMLKCGEIRETYTGAAASGLEEGKQ